MVHISSWVFASHQTSVAPSSLNESNWIFMLSSYIFWILEYTSNWKIQVSNFSTFTSPLYMGSSNLMSNLSNGVFPFGIFEWEWVVFVLDVENEDVDEDDEDEDGGDWGGFPPLPFELFSSSFLPSEYPSPRGGLEPSPALSIVNASNLILTILWMSLKSLLTSSYSECPWVFPTPDIMAKDSSSTPDACTFSITSASCAICTSSVSTDGDRTWGA